MKIAFEEFPIFFRFQGLEHRVKACLWLHLVSLPLIFVRHNGVVLKMRQKCIWFCANIKITFKGIPQNWLQFLQWVARSLIVVFSLVHNCICLWRLQEFHQENSFMKLFWKLNQLKFWHQFAEVKKSYLEKWKMVRWNII